MSNHERLRCWIWEILAASKSDIYHARYFPCRMSRFVWYPWLPLYVFILQSLSSSGASYLSELSRSGKLKSGQQSVKLLSRVASSPGHWKTVSGLGMRLLKGTFSFIMYLIPRPLCMNVRPPSITPMSIFIILVLYILKPSLQELIKMYDCTSMYSNLLYACPNFCLFHSGDGSPSPSHQPWWMGGDSEAAAMVSDHELEATAHSWLKSTTQSRM